jgi:ABC-type branched-subunit amino acid transport system permease subunit
MSAGNLRYYALGAYTGLIALWTSTQQIALNEQTAIALLAPIGILIGADYLKHKNDNA